MPSRRFKILLTPRARRDLEEIAQYTQHQWGPEQTRRYMQELDETIQQLRVTPDTIGTDRDRVKPGLRSLSHKRYHFVFYRVRENRVEVLRVLHQRRDWAKLLFVNEPK